MQTYLIGPIDFVSPIEARSWRADMSSFLKEMGVGVLNPCDKPIAGHDETPDFKHEVQACKEEGQYDRASELMKPICSVDLRMVDKSDFLIAHLDFGVKMCGSIWEIAIARISKKPVIIHAEGGKSAMSNWLFGTCDHNEMFATWNEIKQYLTGINNGSITPNKRWLFFDPSLVF